MTGKHEKPHTEETGTGAEGAKEDVQSDPAASEQSGDWAGEGGATPDGLATDQE
ncbi:hypothetical protein QMK17_10130 [Rhodococcus sp. G-MC3]|uniref:hypothetical protein n=1 Tax=Rhodococcus sp. G-MC3 TaxID=3046209 RepID=UPI0024BA90EF|nr:hypothetical protein [Rhodococcus sp. G-MC3]MDJ0393687.1 hypothetical protein [Rhodococcus sp. G-MC3]